MPKLYNLTKQITELLPQINQKYRLEIEVESGYYYDTIAKDNPLRHKIEIVHLKNIPLDKQQLGRSRFIPAIQEPQIRQILIGLQDVLGIKADKFEKKNLCLTHDLNGRLILPLFNRDPETVLEELVEILENLLK